MRRIASLLALIISVCLSNCVVYNNYISKVEKVRDEFAGSYFYCDLGMITTEIKLREDGRCFYRYVAQSYFGEWEISPNGKYIYIKGRLALAVGVISDDTNEVVYTTPHSIDRKLRIRNKNTLKMTDTKWTYIRVEESTE